MKIAQVLSASTGGIGRHVASIGPRMVERGHQVRVFCPPVTTAAQGFDELGLDVYPVTDLADARGADVIHAHGFKAGGIALPASRVLRTPLVVTWHNAVLGEGRGGRAARIVQRLVARGADLTLGASSDLVDEARRLGAKDAQLAAVAAPALGSATVPRDQERLTLGVGSGETLVLTVSRLAPQKNLSMLAEVAARLRGRRDISFAVVGEGPERVGLEQRIATERLRIRLLGHRDDVPSLLAAADLAFLPSTWEARALVAQEALLAGLPLVSTRVGGIPELVGDAAVLVELGDVAEATRQVVRLADDPALRERLQAAGRQRAADWPTEDEVAEDLLSSYRGLLQRRLDRRR